MSLTNIQSLAYFYPELILSAGVVLVLVLDLLLPDSRKGWLAGFTGIVLILALVFSVDQYSYGSVSLFTNMLTLDPLAVFFKILFAVSSGIVVLAAVSTFRKSGEFYMLLLSATLGMFLLAGAADLVMIFLAFELLSVPAYLLAGFHKHLLTSSEAALKYVLYGAFSSALMLFGMSLLYGLSGETHLFAIHETLVTSNPYPLTVFVAVALILAGVGYKVAMVPFHFWCPDVYEGAPTSVAAFFSIGPKVAGFALLIRLLFGLLSEPESSQLERWIPLTHLIDWPLVIAVIATASMTLGNFAALGQRNVKRLLAYSTIAHTGYLLAGFVVLTGLGLKAVMLYMIVYLLMNLGAFLAIDGIGARIGSDQLKDYRGLGRRAPFMAIALTIFLLSLTGLPPTAGFIGKFYILAALVDERIYWLAIVGVLNSVVSLFYYASIIRAMFLEKGTDMSPIRVPRTHFAIAVILVVPTVVFGIFFGPLLEWTEMSLHLLTIR